VINYNIVVNTNETKDDQVEEILKKIDNAFGGSISNITINLTIVE
jgi:hypothetical protein